MRFEDRRAAYRFVSELRRLYEVDQFVGLAVVRAEDGSTHVVLPAGLSRLPLGDLAAWHGGRPAARSELDAFETAPAERGVARSVPPFASIEGGRTRDEGWATHGSNDDEAGSAAS